MSYNSTLRAAITSAIATPANPKISGEILQGKLLALLDAIDAGALYLGVATPNMAAPTTEANGFFFALTAGTYTNLSGIVVNDDEIAIIYTTGSGWAKATISSGTVVDGYYNATDGHFYADDTYQTQIAGQANKIYISLDTNAMYRYDATDQEFVQTGDSSGEKRVNGTVTPDYYKRITQAVGEYAIPEVNHNTSWKYYDLYVRKNETVFYKAIEHRTTGGANVQPLTFVANGIVKFNPIGSYGSYMIGTYTAEEDGVFTLNQRHDSSGWDDVYLYVIREGGSAVDGRVDGVISSVSALQGKNGIDWKQQTLTDGQNIDLQSVFPWCNKFGNEIQLTCKVKTMGSLKFWFDTPGVQNPSSVYDHRLLTIDDTHIKLYDMNDTTTAIETVAHGVTIDEYLSVNMQCLPDGTMKIALNTLDTVMTIDGNAYCILSHWGYGVGRIKMESDGCELSDVQLSVTNQMFRSPFWMIGASQEGLKNIRYPGQLMKMGYMNVLDNARSGRSSDYALADLKRALDFGKPKFLYFSLSNDGFDPNNYEPRLQAVIDLAEEIGATLIVMARAVHPAGTEPIGGDTVEAQLAKRAYILENAPRVFDFGKAVSSDPNDPTCIYEGYLDGEYLHPANAMAANAVAMQFLADVPELMQYGRVDFDAAERDALHSGINASKVAKLDALPTNASLQTQIGGKQDKTEIETVSTTTASVPMADNTIYNCGVLTALSITLPATITPDYISQVNFTSCANDMETGFSTEFETPPTPAIILDGDDINAQGRFVPVEYKRYMLMLYYDGSNILGIVKGTPVPLQQNENVNE